MKICVYCSSAEGLAPEFYAAGEAFGRALAQHGHTLVYGGYDQGIMGAVASGARAGGAPVIGVIPAIFAQDDFTASCCTQVIHVDTMAQRKAAMEAQADAFAVLPGGIGTYDEFFEALVLRSLGQLDKPIGIYNVQGCYDPLCSFLQSAAAQGFVSQRNLELAPLFSSAAALLAHLEAEY